LTNIVAAVDMTDEAVAGGDRKAGASRLARSTPGFGTPQVAGSSRLQAAASTKTQDFQVLSMFYCVQ